MAKALAAVEGHKWGLVRGRTSVTGHAEAYAAAGLGASLVAPALKQLERHLKPRVVEWAEFSVALDRVASLILSRMSAGGEWAQDTVSLAVLPGVKSNVWVAILLLGRMRERAPAKAWAGIRDRLQLGAEFSGLRPPQRGALRIVLTDDCVYSGQQMADLVSNLSRSTAQKPRGDTCLLVAPVFSTGRGLQVLASTASGSAHNPPVEIFCPGIVSDYGVSTPMNCFQHDVVLLFRSTAAASEKAKPASGAKANANAKAKSATGAKANAKANAKAKSATGAKAGAADADPATGAGAEAAAPPWLMTTLYSVLGVLNYRFKSGAGPGCRMPGYLQWSVGKLRVTCVMAGITCTLFAHKVADAVSIPTSSVVLGPTLGRLVERLCASGALCPASGWDVLSAPLPVAVQQLSDSGWVPVSVDDSSYDNTTPWVVPDSTARALLADKEAGAELHKAVDLRSMPMYAPLLDTSHTDCGLAEAASKRDPYQRSRDRKVLVRGKCTGKPAYKELLRAEILRASSAPGGNSLSAFLSDTDSDDADYADV